MEIDGTVVRLFMDRLGSIGMIGGRGGGGERGYHHSEGAGHKKTTPVSTVYKDLKI